MEKQLMATGVRAVEKTFLRSSYLAASISYIFLSYSWQYKSCNTQIDFRSNLPSDFFLVGHVLKDT